MKNIDKVANFINQADVEKDLSRKASSLSDILAFCMNELAEIADNEKEEDLKEIAKLLNDVEPLVKSLKNILVKKRK